MSAEQEARAHPAASADGSTGGVAARTTGSASRPAYRHDLDGLRAVAIFLVAVYHVWVHRVSGGVDVFLLLSGFFVGGGLLRGFAAGRPVRLRTYLPRLARRLVPTLVVVLAGTGVATWIWLPETRWAGISEQTLASLAYVQNWYLGTSGQQYGAADPGQSPLQHVWSMSVQGQVFVGLPLLLLGLWSVLRRVRPAVRLRVLHASVVVLAAGSFGYAAVAVHRDQSFAYYDTVARAWEYLAGTVLAMVMPWVAARLPRPRLGALLGWAGFALVALAGVLVDGQSRFPGPLTLVPLAGAGMLVLAGAGGDAGVARWSPTALLSRGGLPQAGRYAYAFYLWHWPVLVLTVAVWERPVGWLTGSGVLAASAALAVGTRRLVEEPLREGVARLLVVRRAPRTAATPRQAGTRGSAGRWHAASAAVVLVLAVAVVAAPGAWLGHVAAMSARNGAAGDAELLARHPGALAVVDPSLYRFDPAATPIPDPAAAPADKVRAVGDGCGVATDESRMKVCSYGDLGADRVLAVVGGSHAEHWIDALAAVGEAHGFRVDAVIKWACALSDPSDMPPDIAIDLCVDWNEQVFDYLREDRPDALFVTGTRPTGAPAGPREYVPAGYRLAFAKITGWGIPVVAVRDTPWMPANAPDCIAQHGPQAPECSVPRSAVLDATNPLEELAAVLPGLSTFSVDDIVCVDGTCPYVQGGRIIYRDDHHLTNTYALSLAPVLEERMRPLLGWW